MKHLTFASSLLCLLVCGSCQSNPEGVDWNQVLSLPATHFSATGWNNYFVLVSGNRLYYETSEGAAGERVLITVLDETRVIDGIETRVVEEREWKGDELVEVSNNFLALNKQTNDLYYFGEDVNIYKDGQIVSHSGSWQSGKNGAKYGLFMPQDAAPGKSFYMEKAPKVAMDHARIVSANEVVETPLGTYQNCVKVEETSPLEPGRKSYKYYAMGVGLVADEDLRLVKAELVNR